jgi:ribonuclease HII
LKKSVAKLLSASQFLEIEALSNSVRVAAGVDEAGRGPLAGAVYAAAVILPERHNLQELNDSKKLSEASRDRLFVQISETATSYAIAKVEADEIDRLNILQATMLAMTKAVNALLVRPEFVLVDGNRCPHWSWPSIAVVRGDTRLDCIAAASVLAKVARDREMQQMELLYPGYGFARHKGYPTATHLKALRENGVSAIHRRTFSPVAEVLRIASCSETNV